MIQVDELRFDETEIGEISATNLKTKVDWKRRRVRKNEPTFFNRENFLFFGFSLKLGLNRSSGLNKEAQTRLNLRPI